MSASRSTALIFVIIVLVSFALAGCGGVSTPDIDAAVQMTVQALEAMSATEIPTQAPKEEPTQEPVVQEPTPVATIMHISFPDRPLISPIYLTDQSSIDFADERRTIGDAFIANLYERPFTRETMDYLSYLDITRAQFGYTEPFFYVTIFLQEAPPQGVEARYGIEIDASQDGRGEWLVMGKLPQYSAWTTEGVQVWHDSNGDVGGAVPLRMEPYDPIRDGYDELLFDEGQGEDADMAWIRRDPDHADRIQVAFKATLIEPQITFLWLVWSDAQIYRPEWMDYNDHFTPEEAGSPAIVDDTYPLGEVAALDDTYPLGVRVHTKRRRTGHMHGDPAHRRAGTESGIQSVLYIWR
jgi:hypothetical protein